jgi:hypothetical protein
MAIKEIKASENFETTYGLVLCENMNFDEIQNAEDFIKQLENIKNNPYINVVFKKYSFTMEKHNKTFILDDEGKWEVLEKAKFIFDDKSIIKIYANNRTG